MKWTLPRRRPPAARIVTLALAAIALAGCDRLGELPAKVRVDDVIAATSSGFFMEACVNDVYRLSDDTAGTVMRQGAAFFRDIEPPRQENPQNRYRPWQATPVPADPRIHADRAIGGCGDNGPGFHGREIGRALRRPGSFYAVTANGEGMILVMPRERLAAFLYFG